MRVKAGEAVYDFHTFSSMNVDHERIIEALAKTGRRLLDRVPLSVEVDFREVGEAPIQDYWFPEPSMTPEEFDRSVRESLRQTLTLQSIHPEAVHEHTRRLAELVRGYHDVRFRSGSGTVGGSFRPGLITIYLLPGQDRQETLTDHLIATLAHETYHAASFRTADRRRGLFRQHLGYQDDRGFQVLEEILGCFYAREVCRTAGCPAAVEDGVTREFLRIGEAVLTRNGQDFAGMSGLWLLTGPAVEAFWDAHGDAVFRSLHAVGSRPSLA